MPGSKTLTLNEVRAAVAAIAPENDFVWDGADDDDRPASDLELASARRGRPRVVAPKLQLTLRLDRDVVAAFRSTGAGWQSRMNDALRDWIAAHSAS